MTATLTMSERMEALRNAVPGCLSVAFADLSTGLVLSVSAARRQPQEEVDALCAMAVALLDGPVAQGAARVLDGPVNCAVAMQGHRCFAFLRSADDPVEALCCLGGSDLDPEALFAAGRMTLAGIGKQE